VNGSVELTVAEFSWAVDRGLQAWNEQQAAGRRDHWGLEADPCQTHVDGWLYEMAVAKWLGYPWGYPYGRYRQHPDYGRLEIRGSDWHDTSKLLVHPPNPDHSPYVLVTRTKFDHRTYEVRGYLYGHEAKKERYWKYLRPDRPAYAVERVELYRDLDTLYALGVSMSEEQDLRHWEEHGGAFPGRELISVEWPNGFRALFSFPQGVDLATFERVIERYRMEIALGKHSRLRASD
jgi:hypothetical protein